jgi:beta-glucanase (GH16 family)
VYEINGNGGGNNELEYYSSRSQNSYIDSGSLVIKALKESYSGKQYTSARMHTKDSWQYGKIEARIKLPFGQGIWPAFWMLGSNLSSVGWPACGEIDIMEMIGGTMTSNGGDGRVFGTAHWSNNGSHAQYGLNYALASGKLSDDFHTYWILWDADQIRWFIDSHLYCTLSLNSSLAAFRDPFFIIINLAVGGNWPGSPDASTVFPQTMQIDYIRVYQPVTTSIYTESGPVREFSLSQNYPNPFNPATTIKFTIPSDGLTTVTIFNAIGKEIASLVNEELKAGEYHQVHFNGQNFASGLYFYRLQSGNFIETKKMILMK